MLRSMTAMRRFAALAIVGALLGGCSAAVAAPTPREQAAAVSPLRYAVVGDAAFRSEVWAILDSPSSWTSELVIKADSGPVDFYIWLASPADANSRCGTFAWMTAVQQHNVNCSYGNMIVINSERWFNGRVEDPPIIAPIWRRIVVNHEVGHQLGFPDGEGPCSIMNSGACPGGQGPDGPDDKLRALAREWLSARTATA